MPETRAETLRTAATIQDLQESLTTHIDERMAAQDSKMEKAIAEVFAAVKILKDSQGASSSTDLTRTPVEPGHTLDQTRGRTDPTMGYRPGTYTNFSGLTRLAKLEFPRFAGDRIKEWLFKAEQFFALDHTPEEAKISLASIHFEEQAATWHQSVIQSDGGLHNIKDWVTYKALLLERFAETFDDPIAELKLLQETDSILEYNTQFENIRTRVQLSEAYLVSAYLAGLRLDTQMHVRMFQPQSIRHCFLLGRLYESAHPRKSPVPTWTSPKTVNHTPPPAPTPGPSPTFKRDNTVVLKDSNPKKFLSSAEMSERRAKGLCFLCDEKYTPEHYLTHKKARLFLLETEEEEQDVVTPPHSDEEPESSNLARLSVNAVEGISAYKTMRIRGYHGKKVIFSLIDSGSTHNFMHPSLAAKLGVTLHSLGATHVSVADGRKLDVVAVVKDFQWVIQGHSFQADFLILPLGGCDMVLGIQWLHTLGNISWDFTALVMQFQLNNKKVILKGLHPGSIRQVKAERLSKLQDSEVQLSMLWTHVSQLAEHSADPETLTLNFISGTDPHEGNSTEVAALLEEFADLFLEPTVLPPFRTNHNHKIPLKDGADPINLRPYRYALHQKDEIDRLVREMLATGIIQPSSSSFASPVVLVKKKDGTWRLCVDYRGLNNLTIKNRFPIPLVEDLMDELGGATLFSKIDLRAGYHQVRMEPEDISKTAFKTHNGHYEYLVMPFGLTNAPATFQGLMNEVFRPFLRKFVLIFFDDILIYSSGISAHLSHLRSVFEAMRQNQLAAKMSKCEFAVRRVEYLGHFIQAEGISTDPAKISAVKDWPVPKNVKQLRGFLGLAGYYRRFVRHFGSIAKPLTQLTKKDSFGWNGDTQSAFDKLKDALCTTPVLALPNFSKPFVVETDACSDGIGAVLMQEGHPLAFISRHLKGTQLHFSIYEKELLAVVFAVQKWRHYLISSHFVIRTDQRSLKYLLEQRLNTPIQQQWLPKLLEFDYEIQYREGKDNLVADALSRVEGSDILHMSLSVLECDLLRKIQDAYESDLELKPLIAALKLNPHAKKHFTWSQNILRRKCKIVVPLDTELKNLILEWLHCGATSGHSGRDVTYKRVKSLFYWRGMNKDIQTYIRSCDVCQRNKYDTAAYPGLIQPLPIPLTVWSAVSMDFIEGLPVSFGMSVIYVVVDRLTKAAHFIALAHPYTALTVAQAYLDNVYKHHGFPESFVSDRDPVFQSTFWSELFRLQGVELQYSSAYHPQSDGQTEVVNRCLETYLRCMTSDRPKQWSKWLPLAEFWYNTTFHTATQMTPYEAVYGQPPPQHLPYLPGESKVAVVDRGLQDRESMLLILKFHLLRAQHRMQLMADAHRTDRQLDIGDFVFVKLQPYRQSTLVPRPNQKLAPKYYGPYKIIDRCGQVAYKLALPPDSSIHPVFHVSQLKLCVGQAPSSSTLPSIVSDALVKEPVRILERRMVQRHGRAATQVLIQWSNESEEEATWEWCFDIKRKFPDFQS